MTQTTTDGADEVPMLNEKYALNNSQTTLGRDIETVRKALQRLKEHGIENLIRSGYSPTDACTISDRNNEEVPAFERVAKQLIMWEVSHGSRI